MVIFEKKIKTKSDQNTHQIAPFKKFLGGACPRTPPDNAQGCCASRHTNSKI